MGHAGCFRTTSSASLHLSRAVNITAPMMATTNTIKPGGCRNHPATLRDARSSATGPGCCTRAALRRLAAKTQVVVPGETRLPAPHPADPLAGVRADRPGAGEALGCDPDLVETACLAHDLGHPPFGHNGETALDELGAAAAASRATRRACGC